jgi:hypothetical protein
LRTGRTTDKLGFLREKRSRQWGISIKAHQKAANANPAIVLIRQQSQLQHLPIGGMRPMALLRPTRDRQNRIPLRLIQSCCYLIGGCLALDGSAACFPNGTSSQNCQRSPNHSISPLNERMS